MTILDLVSSIQIQGNVIVKQWDDNKETYNTLAETDTGIFKSKILNKEIKYMYAVDNNLIIEVE